MVKLKSEKRGAEMALNTIVIALLVIIVLVVMIFIFTSGITDSSEDLEKQRNLCSPDNPVAITQGYNDARAINSSEESCNDAESRIPGIRNCCFS